MAGLEILSSGLGFITGVDRARLGGVRLVITGNGGSFGGLKRADGPGTGRRGRWARESELVQVTAMCLELTTGLVEGLDQIRGNRVDDKTSDTVKAGTAGLELQIPLLDILGVFDGNKISLGQRDAGWAILLQLTSEVGYGDGLKAVRAAHRGDRMGLVIPGGSSAHGESENGSEGSQGMLMGETGRSGLYRARQRGSIRG